MCCTSVPTFIRESSPPRLNCRIFRVPRSFFPWSSNKALPGPTGGLQCPQTPRCITQLPMVIHHDNNCNIGLSVWSAPPVKISFKMSCVSVNSKRQHPPQGKRLSQKVTCGSKILFKLRILGGRKVCLKLLSSKHF